MCTPYSKPMHFPFSNNVIHFPISKIRYLNKIIGKLTDFADVDSMT